MNRTPGGDRDRDWYVRLDSLSEPAMNAVASQLVALNASTRVATIGSDVWVRTTDSSNRSNRGSNTKSNGDLLSVLRRLPGVIFHVHDKGGLVRFGDNVPSVAAHESAEPPPQWLPIEQVCEVVVPVPQIARRDPNATRRPVQLIRGGVAMPCNAMLTQLAHLHEWIEWAPKARIDRLRWTCRGDECLMMGDPLPPIEGRYFVCRDRVIAPAGMTWTPAVPNDVLLTTFGVSQSEWLLWETEDRWSLVPDDTITVMSRGGVRSAFASSHANRHINTPRDSADSIDAGNST